MPWCCSCGAERADVAPFTIELRISKDQAKSPVFRSLTAGMRLCLLCYGSADAWTLALRAVVDGCDPG